MLNSAKSFLEGDSYLMSSNIGREWPRSFMNFCERMSHVFEIKDFLLALQAQIPKKFKTGEILLLYESQQLGLRRAYVKAGVFYEQEAKNPWPPVDEISPSSARQSLYLAEEFGRPFSKNLMIPFACLKEEAKAVLFVEMRQEEKFEEPLTDFFKTRILILNLVLKRALLNARFIRVSYLWSQLFSHWQEPLATVQNFKIIQANEAFKRSFSSEPEFIKQKKLSGLLETGQKIYQLHYYPISQCKNSASAGILYCQDMTRHVHLREQLFQSEKMASLCVLGKNMAHQLNNPLTGVRSMVQILRQTPGLEEFQEEFIEAEKTLQRSQKIIENLLSFSQTKEEQKACDLNQAVQDTLPLLKSATQGLLIQMELCQQPVEVKGDMAILQQIIYNLILNACQALKADQTKSGASAHIQIRTEKNSTSQARLKIRDNGPGISPENLEKIFQPLWTNKKSGQGTGFGLGIARQFAQQLKGSLLAESREKEYACFTVTLPLSRPDESV